jgi:zinc metalloprotease ZmpB
VQMKLKPILFLLLLFLVAFSVQAQNARVQQSIEEVEYQTSFDSDGRIDRDTGVRRASYRLQDRVVYRSAKAFLEAERQVFGWKDPDKDLTLVSDRSTTESRHVTYQQTFKGVPVLDHQVRVNLDRAGRVSLVMSSFEALTVGAAGFNTTPSMTSSAARSLALELAANGKGRSREAELGIIQPSQPRLVWEVIVWPKDEPAEYRVHIDAQTGELVRLVNQAISLRDRHDSEVPWIDGTGYVYDPSPLYKAGVFYGAPYVDGDDATNSFLDAARVSVTLNGLTQNEANKWVLKGPYVSITGMNQGGTEVYTPPAENSLDGFKYTRSQTGFEAVNAYYHLDKSQRYIQGLGITDRLAQPFSVNPQGLTRDDSFFFPTANMILFGTGGVDDAEDPTVLWHEYAHALLEAASPGLLSTQEGAAFHEGWADYWAASYLRSQVESGESLRSDWRKLFAWDSGDGEIWNGRTLNHQGIYPQSLCFTTSSGCSVHDDGRMWATTMMEVYDQIGREKTDLLSLLSHAYLIAPMTFADAAEAVIQADLDYNAGANTAILVDVFSKRGLVKAGSYAPVIVHTPLPDSELLGGSLSVSAQAFGVSSNLVSLQLFAQSATGGVQQVVMSPAGGNVYGGIILLPAQRDSVFYYLRAEDAGGSVSFLPQGAPQTRYKFNVGEDLHAPVIAHQPVQDAGFNHWPLRITSNVTDNYSVQSVILEYELKDKAGTVVSAGQKSLSAQGSLYSTLLDIPFEYISNGSNLQYALKAKDGSEAGNTSRYPETGFVELTITAEGVLRTATFESSELDLWTSSGQWEKGVPTYGRSVAFNGEGVIGTRLSDSYSDGAGQSILQMEPINLSGVKPAILSFWHYYDTEHDGSVDPGSANGAVWDGGLIQYKSNVTQEWTTIQPEGGYPGIIQNDPTNTFRGQPAFGGFSFGWQRSSFLLPEENNLMIRFVFSTNATNEHTGSVLAGWIIDQVEISTDAIVDVVAPEIEIAPASSVVASVSAPLPFVSASFLDNTGVTSVTMQWTYTTSSGTVSGTDWLTQDPEDISLFSIQTAMAFGAAPGDRLSYYLEVADAFSNTIRVPSGVARNEIVFRIQDQINPIESVWASGGWVKSNSGRWEVTGEMPGTLSSLNSNSISVPQNAIGAVMQLTHAYQFGQNMAGQVEISDDGGSHWTLLEPDEGYPGTASSNVHSSIRSEKSFIGSSNGTVVSAFALSSFVGSNVLIRLTSGAGDSSTINQTWSIQAIEITFESEDVAFEVPSKFEVFSVYPNPLVDRSNLVFTLPERLDIDLKIFDILGREVQHVWSGSLGEGSHSLTLERDNLVSGVYLIQVKAGSSMKVVKVVVTN